MTAVCPSCGHEFTNVQTSSTVGAFFEKLDAINQEVYEKEAAKEAKEPSGGVFGAVMGMGLNAMTRAVSGTGAGIKRQIALIEGYPIPNSKEDILEFVLLASSRYKGVSKPLIPAFTGSAEKMEVFKLDDAWRTKCNQAYNKAKITFGSDKVALAQVEAIVAEVDKAEKKSRKKFVIGTICVISIIAAYLIFSFVILPGMLVACKSQTDAIYYP
jgi:hypothetical protein